jgi:hypothetical protein
MAGAGIVAVAGMVAMLALCTLGREMMHGRPRDGMLHHLIAPFEARLRSENVTLPQDQWFTQTLNHFDVQDTRTFQQRYQVNDTFYEPGGPLFIMISGEGPASAVWLYLETDIMMNAQQFNAIAVQIEHRFYGETHPLPDLSMESLAYLSSEQALADIATFVDVIFGQYKLPADTQVVTFGGSYAGAMSAFFRTKYPQIADAAVATSGPVNAVLDFYQYQDVVQASLLTTPQGDLCVANIQSATNQIQQLLQSPNGIKQLISQFQICPDSTLSTPLDVSNFMQSLASNVDGIVQYNDENQNPQNISWVCSIMTAEGKSPLDQYVILNNLILASYEEPCLDVSYPAMISMMQNTSWGSEADGMRQWIYQTCIEFGYYQTTDSKTQPFGTLFPLSFSLDQCQDIYGIPGPNTNWTNADYGGLNIAGTKIIMPNGSIDPWHALSILSTSNPGITTIFINGTAHCANMLPPSPSDPQSLVQARFEIQSILSYYLQSGK